MMIMLIDVINAELEDYWVKARFSILTVSLTMRWNSESPNNRLFYLDIGFINLTNTFRKEWFISI